MEGFLAGYGPDTERFPASAGEGRGKGNAFVERHDGSDRLGTAGRISSFLRRNAAHKFGITLLDNASNNSAMIILMPAMIPPCRRSVASPGPSS